MAKKTKSPKLNNNKKKIDIDQILLHNRQLFLFDVINDKTATKIIKELVALDKVSSSPIALYINSPGGSVVAGFSIIDIIMGLRANVVTIVFGSACSMAGLIAIAGRYRMMSQHSVIMFHDMSAFIVDYATKIIDRTDFVKATQKKICDYLRERTKLTKADLEKAKNGELWLNPGQALEKGVVNQLLTK